MNWCILIPVLVGLLSALLGYLLGRLVGGGNNGDYDYSHYENKIASLEADLEACRAIKTNKNISASMAPSASSASASTSSAFDANAAKAVFGKRIKQDDLTVVEGIGPKIQELFHNHNVKTWKALSECSVAKCQEVLDSGGDRFKMHVPSTWPKQAKLAYQGKWQELLDWQDQLDGGKA